MTEKRIVETVDQGRQGETSNHMRWVLLATMVMSIAAIGAAWVWIIRSEAGSYLGQRAGSSARHGATKSSPR